MYIVCGKMNSLSTTEDASHDDESIAAFMSVLACTMAEAEFFLESSLWNIEDAVHLYLENNQSVNRYKPSSHDWDPRVIDTSTKTVKYIKRIVMIDGLPEGK